MTECRRCAERDGEAEVDGGLNDGICHLLWRSRRADRGRLCVMATLFALSVDTPTSFEDGLALPALCPVIGRPGTDELSARSECLTTNDIHANCTLFPMSPDLFIIITVSPELPRKPVFVAYNGYAVPELLFFFMQTFLDNERQFSKFRHIHKIVYNN